MRFTRLVKRDIFLAAVLEWMTPFLAALSMIDIAVFNSPARASASLPCPERLSVLTTFFIRVLTARLRNRRFMLCKFRLTADLWFANVLTPFEYFYKNKRV